MLDRITGLGSSRGVSKLEGIFYGTGKSERITSHVVVSAENFGEPGITDCFSGWIKTGPESIIVISGECLDDSLITQKC